MEEILKEFNFLPMEAAVYKALLEAGGLTVSELAYATGIKRTSCHDYLRSLQQKGFVNQTKTGGKIMYQAEDPDKFSQIVHERMQVVDRLAGELVNRSVEEQIGVRVIGSEEGQTLSKKLEREEEPVCFGGGDNRGEVFSELILLFSRDKDLPTIEIRSKLAADFHKEILRIGSGDK